MHRPAAATIILLLPIANIRDLIRIDARGTTTAFDSRAGVVRPLAGLAQKQEPGCSGGEAGSRRVNVPDSGSTAKPPSCQSKPTCPRLGHHSTVGRISGFLLSDLIPVRFSRCGDLPGPSEFGAVGPDAMHDHANRRAGATICFFIARCLAIFIARSTPKHRSSRAECS